MCRKIKIKDVISEYSHLFEVIFESENTVPPDISSLRFCVENFVVCYETKNSIEIEIKFIGTKAYSILKDFFDSKLNIALNIFNKKGKPIRSFKYTSVNLQAIKDLTLSCSQDIECPSFIAIFSK